MHCIQLYTKKWNSVHCIQCIVELDAKCMVSHFSKLIQITYLDMELAHCVRHSACNRPRSNESQSKLTFHSPCCLSHLAISFEQNSQISKLTLCVCTCVWGALLQHPGGHSCIAKALGSQLILRVCSLVHAAGSSSRTSSTPRWVCLAWFDTPSWE